MEDDEEDEEYEDFDFLLFTKLMDAREMILKVLQNRNYDIMMRMSIVLDLTQKIQDAIDQDEIFTIDDMLDDFKEMNALLELQNYAEKHSIGESEFCASMRKIFRVFQKLEVLKSDWPEIIKHAEMKLYGNGQSFYENNRQEFHRFRGLNSEKHEEWAIWLEQLMVYFVFTYFCGAVYDDNVIGKMKTAIVATLLIQELAIARWLDKDKSLTFDDFVDIAHRVSREIEHSDLNLIRLEKIFDKTPVMETRKLLDILLTK
jgi:lysine-N-methylase